MPYYSLVSSLPHLKIGGEPPFSTEEYIADCARWITTDEIRKLERVLQCKHHCGPCSLCKIWFDIETQLRNAIARHRAQKLGVDYNEYQQAHAGYRGDIEQLITDAFARNDPLETEEEIDRARWQLAEELIGQEMFSFKKILAYGIQLKIVERWDSMDVHAGKERLEAVITANTEKEEAQEQ